MASPSTWRTKRDALHRGDAQALSTPDPKASPSIVQHVLYLGGAGRPTPYHSTSEEREVAKTFAGPKGRVWETRVREIEAAGAKHLSRLELLQLLKGKGKGAGAWPSAFEVMQARRYVEQWSEHLVSYAGFPDAPAAEQAAKKVFR